MTEYGNVERTKEQFIDLSVINCDTGRIVEPGASTSRDIRDHSYAKHVHSTELDHNYVNSSNNRIVNDALEYLGGYVCYKTQSNVQRLNENVDDDTDSWVAKVSEGGLVTPNSKDINGDFICDKPGLLARMIKKAELIDISKKFKLKYLRSRIYFRIRHLNNKSKLNIIDKAKKSKRKIKKL